MGNENNKFQVDIENLFKQNVNDLSAIKELYRKLKEVEEKITQFKYIDNTLVKKLKKEYENLKKIILDENVQLQLDNKIDEFNEKLTNDIETINSQLDKNAQHLLSWINVTTLIKNNINFNTLLQQCVNKYSIVYIPKGTYEVETINIPVGVKIIGDGEKTIIKHISTTENCFVLSEGYSGSIIENITITGGAEGTNAIECNRPHCQFNNVKINNYVGNGILLGQTESGISCWCNKLTKFQYIGNFTSKDEKKQSEVSNRYAIKINCNGGNIIIDKANIQCAINGIEVEKCAQLSIINSNISEINKHMFPNTSLKPTAILINGGESIEISKCYIENFTLGIVSNSVDGLMILNSYINGLGMAGQCILLNSNNSQNITLINNKIINISKNGYCIALQNGPQNTTLINNIYDKTKFVNSLNTGYYEILNNSIYGAFQFTGAKDVIKDWLECSGSQNSGDYQIPKTSHNETFTSGNVTFKGTCTYILPSGVLGQKIKFIKEKHTSSVTMIIKPQTAQYIFPIATSAGVGIKSTETNGGYIEFVRTSYGWCINNMVGSWISES